MRPRKAQIDNLKTSYSELVLQPIVGATSTSIIPADVYNYTITDTDGGVEEDIPARTVANPIAPPYLISPGDSFSVRLNGAPSITITFAASDTNISRIVDKINLTLGVVIAFNKNGYLLLQSNVTGDNSQLILNDVVVGTLTKLGLSAGTYNGSSAPKRGIVTKSNQIDDNGSDLGGFVALKTLDQKSIILDNQYLRKVNTNSVNGTLYTTDAPVGIPVNSRITFVGGIYVIKYYATGPGPAELITSSSSFSSLDGTDSFNLTFSTVNYDGSSRNLVSTIVSGITFPAAPYTRDSVIQRINQVVAAAINPNGAGAARVIGRNRQPFNVNGLTLKMAIDGGGVVAYTFGSITTAVDIANAITANFPGVTATPASGGTQIKITSNNINGYSSSIEILGSQSNPVANILGIQPGLYRGLWIAEPYGYDEIRLATWVHGYSSLLGVSGLAQTLTRLGLSNTIVHGSDNKEKLVSYPKVNPNQTKILTIIPEVIDPGESRDNTESINTKFNSQSLSNNEYFNQVLDISQPPSNNWFSSANEGVKTAGKPIITNLSGQIDRDYLRNALDEIYGLVKQFTNGTYLPGFPSISTVGGGYINGLFQSLVASRLLTNDIREYSPGSITNVDINFSPDLATASGHYHESKVTVGVNVTPSNIISKLRWEYDGISTVDLDLKVIYDLGFAFNKSAFGSSSGECNLFDANTISSGTLLSGKKYLPLTSSDHQYLRIGEQYNNTDTNISILKNINARYSITIGNGTTTFGDFNGTSALNDALTWALASGAIDIAIDVKQGTYIINASIDFASAPSNLKLTLNGKGQNTIINFGVEAFYFYNTQSVILNNIYLYSNTTNLAITLYNRASVVANNVTSWNITWTIDGISNITINDSALTVDPYSKLFWLNVPGNISTNVGSSGLHVYNSFLTGGTILYIQNTSDDIPKTRFDKIIFRDCKIDLTGESTVIANSLTAARGLIGIGATTSNGFYIDSLAFYNCNVTQKTGSVYGTVIYLTPNRYDLENTSYFDINTIIIDGGTWLAPYTDQTMNPFTIVSNYNIFIRNVKFGFFGFGGGQTHGGPILQHEKWFANGTSGSPVLTASTWGMLAVRADYLEMDNIILNTNRNSNSGDLFIFTPENGTSKLNNINIVVNTDAGGSSPTNRIRLRNYNPLLVEIDKLLFRSIDSATVGTSILYVEPNGYAPETELSITNSYFNLLAGGTPADAIYLAGVSSIGSIYTSSPRDFTNVILSSNKITRCQNGIEVGIGNSNQVFNNINIENNIINNCAGSAIYFRICNGRNFNFINNILSQNTSYGIYIEDGVDANHSLSYNIMNNRCSSNNGGYNGIQIRLRLLDASSHTYKLVDSIIIGNNCCDTGDGAYAYDTLSTWGKIKINRIVGNSAIALSTLADHINSPKGANTGFSSSTDDVLKFDTTMAMVLNQATLETP